MRRALGLALLGAVALALAVSPGARNPVTQLGPDRAVAADCTWKRSVKRVVKRVKRHGKVRRVVRRKVRWTCVPPAPVIPAPAPVTPSPPPPEEEPEANRVSARAEEFYFTLSRPSVKAGEVTVELNNQGEDPHNLNLRLAGSEGAALEIPETDSEERSVASFDLPAGKYKLWCSLPEHEEKGMTTTLQVG